MSSAVRKIAISGACMTPAMTPAMPISEKFLSEMAVSKPRALEQRANTKPVMAPTKSDGAKVPPTPPPPLVAEVAKALLAMMATMNRMMNQTWLPSE